MRPLPFILFCMRKTCFSQLSLKLKKKNLNGDSVYVNVSHLLTRKKQELLCLLSGCSSTRCLFLPPSQVVARYPFQYFSSCTCHPIPKQHIPECSNAQISQHPCCLTQSYFYCWNSIFMCEFCTLVSNDLSEPRMSSAHKKADMFAFPNQYNLSRVPTYQEIPACQG